MREKIIIVSNRLPVTFEKINGELTSYPSSGGLVTGLDSIYKKGDNLWLGWPGVDLDKPHQKMAELQLKEKNMAPIFLSKSDIKDFYEGFSNKTIWPLFHYFTEFAQYKQNLWEAYKRVNISFSEEVIKYAKSDETIWIHDYQLLLLSSILREKLPRATIGFFLHIPFPSFEIFRLLPWRKQIIEGIMGADLVGFHTYDDMRHFLSSVSRILGINNTMGRLAYKNKLVFVDAFPMGINYEKYKNSSSIPKVQKKIKKYKNFLSDQKIILSIDRLDYTKGIKQRIEAFDIFLEKYSEYKGKVSLFLIVVPSRDRVGHYKQLKEEIDTLVGRLDGKHGWMTWTPIHYFYRSFSFYGLSALYNIAQVALITPIRDGMNLVCKEYIASKLDKKGVLILSEMAGSAQELSEAILINPNDQMQIVEALNNALSMPEEEQIAHNAEMQEKLQRYNIHNWVEIFMKQLKLSKMKQNKLQMHIISEKKMHEIFTHYQKASKRILFLDYDGTLIDFSPNIRSVKPDKELINILRQLASDEKNKIVIISGRDKISLEEWFGKENINLIAEHGIWYKQTFSSWKILAEMSSGWKEKIRHILELYVDRTPGSFIEDKDYSLVWHYRKAELHFGEMRARELLSNINYLITNMDLKAMEGNKVVEIKSRSIHKGSAATYCLKQDSYDFVMAIGDDKTDEDTFKAMPVYGYTIKIGFGTSQAKFKLRSHQEARQLLSRLL